MIYILTGIIAFLFLFFFDVYTLKNQGVKKHFFGLTGLGLLIFSAIMVTVVSGKYAFPILVRCPAWFLWAVSAMLLAYSLFFELPFDRTYSKKQHSTILVETGTYALCRHPGVLWFAFLFLFFFFATGARLLITAGVIWTSLDILHVCLQEKLFFPKMFPGYAAYIDNTPMLIPTAGSMKKCITTIMRRRNDDDKPGRNAQA